MIYLATPYSHDDPDVRQWRFRVAAYESSLLMNQGFQVFSPICHSHPIAVAGGLPTGWDYWEPYDRKMMSICDHMHILRLPGWQSSVGLNAEMDIAREICLPVTDIEREFWDCGSDEL